MTVDFGGLCRKRRSVRRYLSRPVERELLDKILATMMTAPSAGNLQAYEIVIVEDDETRRALAGAALGQECISEAPVALVFVALVNVSEKRYGPRGRLFSIQDATIACTYAMLAAEELGLATVWVGAFDDAAVSNVIGAKSGGTPVAILPLGYAGESPRQTGRKPLREIVREIRGSATPDADHPRVTSGRSYE